MQDMDSLQNNIHIPLPRRDEHPINTLAGPHINKKPRPFSLGLCGERGIRTPGTLRYSGFQDRRNRPLCHLSNGMQM